MKLGRLSTRLHIDTFQKTAIFFKSSILYAEDTQNNIRDFICHPHIIKKTDIRLCIPLEGQKAFGLNNDQMRGKIRYTVNLGTSEKGELDSD